MAGGDIGGNPRYANPVPVQPYTQPNRGGPITGNPLFRDPSAPNPTTTLPGDTSTYADRQERAPRASQPTAPAAPPPPPPVSTSDRIRLLQIKLNGMGAHLEVDGIMGPKTQAAMQQYGLDVNGNPVRAASAVADAQGAPVTSSAAPAPTAPAPAANPQAIEEQVRSQYGYLGTILLDQPDIHKVLFDAISGGWSPAQVQGALMGTNYWKLSQASQRNWDVLTGSDPASANAQILQQATDIAATANKLGFSIPADRLKQMSIDALRFGWDAQQVQQAIGNEYHYTPGPQGGSLGTAQMSLRQMAADYLVPLSDQTLADYETQIAKGLATPDGYKNIFAQQAKSLYGDGNEQVSKQLDAGSNMQQIVDPYRQLAAKDLGIAPDSIDWTDPKWMKLLSTVDQKTGTRRMMSMQEAQSTWRGDPADAYGFQQSALGKQMAAQMTAGLAQSLGKLAA